MPTGVARPAVGGGYLIKNGDILYGKVAKGYLTIIAYTIFYLLCSRLHFFRVSSISFLSCLPAVYSCLQFVLIRQFTNTSGVLRQGEDFCDLKSWFLSGLRHSEASKL